MNYKQISLFFLVLLLLTPIAMSWTYTVPPIIKITNYSIEIGNTSIGITNVTTDHVNTTWVNGINFTSGIMRVNGALGLAGDWNASWYNITNVPLCSGYSYCIGYRNGSSTVIDAVNGSTNKVEFSGTNFTSILVSVWENKYTRRIGLLNNSYPYYVGVFDPVLAWYNNKELIGIGMPTIVFTEGDDVPFDLSNCIDCVVSGIKWDGNFSIQYPTTSIISYGLKISNSKNIRITQNRFINFDAYVIYGSNADEVRVDNNRFEWDNGTEYHSSRGGTWICGDHITIENNNITDVPGGGIIVASGSTCSTEDVLLKGNHILANASGTRGDLINIAHANSGKFMRSITISENFLDSRGITAQGISFDCPELAGCVSDESTVISNVTVDGNHIKNQASNSIKNRHRLRDVTISNNHIKMQDSSTQSQCIQLGSNETITWNSQDDIKIYNNDMSGCDYGILMSSNGKFENVTMSFNTLKDIIIRGIFKDTNATGNNTKALFNNVYGRPGALDGIYFKESVESGMLLFGNDVAGFTIQNYNVSGSVGSSHLNNGLNGYDWGIRSTVPTWFGAGDGYWNSTMNQERHYTGSQEVSDLTNMTVFSGQNATIIRETNGSLTIHSKAILNSCPLDSPINNEQCFNVTTKSVNVYYSGAYYWAGNGTQI